MKRIFNTAVTILAALVNINALADEGEIYEAELINRAPQVLIILDTSSHMNEEVDYAYPPVYDPNIAYPPVNETLGSKLVHDVFGSESTYYNISNAAKDIDHTDLLGIAEDQLENYYAGTPFTPDASYTDFLNTIPRLNSEDKFKAEEMNCYSALADFDGDLGAYQDFAKQWLPVNTKLTAKFKWEEIGGRDTFEGDTRLNYVDCQGDIAGETSTKKNPGFEHYYNTPRSDMDDGVEDGYSADTDRQGYPRNGAKEYYEVAYHDTPVNFNTSSGVEHFKTYLYSDNLVKWREIGLATSSDPYFIDGDGNFKLSNLQVAKKAILDLMLTSKDIKIGMEIFNSNEIQFDWQKPDNNHGGRILAGMQFYDDADEAKALRKRVGKIMTTNYTKSALCESLYEGYLYLYGKQIEYGNKVSSMSRPVRDKSVENDANTHYLNPLLEWSQTCQTEAYVIIVSAGYHDISDSAFNLISCKTAAGDHDHDDNANDDIKALSNVDTSKVVQVNGAGCGDNYLPVLSHWLANNDINPGTADVKERIVTYTVGIGELPAGNQELLEKTAEYGDGKFYNALTANQLSLKLQTAFADIIARQRGSASSVGTSISSTNTTQSSEFVYYSMFEPNSTSRWSGNLRKLKVTNTGVLSAWTASASAAPAVSSTVAPVISTGNAVFFKDNLYSGWSSEQGLNDVRKGGVVESLKNRSVTLNPRTIYINSADNSSLLKLTKANLMTALGVTEDAELAEELGIEVANITDSINWLKGLNETLDAYRSDIFGDPMHSAPLVIPYSDGNRIFIGTNAGFFHAFKDNGRTVKEEWAFIPRELLANALKLRTVTQAENRIYGIDGTAVDAEYTDGQTTRHIITVGLRRGGKSYYSFRVDEGLADQPLLNWVISKTSGGNFDELGQTWSTPVVTKVLQANSSDKPVLIFGGGYDTDKDSCGVNGTDPCSDTEGRAVYIVNAVTGALIKSFSNAIGCGDHCLNDSIAAKLAVLDTDGDGYSDRIYAPDTGGNIYRVDMPSYFDVSENQFSSDTDNWTLVKRAKLGGSSAEADRRFFNPPSIVRAKDLNGYSYDGLLLGSGDVTKPNSNVKTGNYFFNIKDTYISPVIWGSGIGKVAKPAPIELKNLTEISYSSTNKLDTITAVASENNINGWKYELTEADTVVDGLATKGGEKSLGGAVVIKGTVHFNSYTPFSSEVVIADGQCVLNQSGNSHYYQISLNTGKTKFYRKLPNVIAKDMVVHAASDSGAPVLRLLGVGKGDEKTVGETTVVTGTVDTKVSLIPRSVYRYFDEAVY